MEECSHSCGGGFQTKTRTSRLEDQSHSEGEIFSVTVNCNVQECPGIKFLPCQYPLDYEKNFFDL